MSCKSTLTVFPYHKTPEGKIFLRLWFKGKSADTSALLDSGATTSIFRPEVAEELGLGVEKGGEIYLTGVGGRIKGYLHNLKVEVAGKQFVCPIVFSYEFTVSLNLLGREKVFPNFVIVFDEKKKKVELKQ